MPGFPCCCKKGPFDYYIDYGKYQSQVRNELILTPSRWPAGTFFLESTYSSQTEGFAPALDEGDSSYWTTLLADVDDRIFSLRVGPNANHHDKQLGDPTGYILEWEPSAEARYSGKLWARQSPSSLVYAVAQMQLFDGSSGDDYLLEIIAESDTHQHVRIELYDLGYGETTVIYTFSIDLFAKTCSGGGFTVDLGDGRTSYRFSVSSPYSYVPGKIRFYLTDSASTFDYTGPEEDESHHVRLYRASLYPFRPDNFQVRDLVIMDVPTGVRKVHYLPFYLESHFSDQYWRFVEFSSLYAFSAVQDVFFDVWWTMQYALYNERVVSPGSVGPAPHPDMLVNPGVRPFSAFGGSVGEGKAGLMYLQKSIDGKGGIASTVGFPQLAVIYEYDETGWRTIAGRTGSVPYRASLEDDDEWLPEPYSIPPHSYPNIFGIDWARDYDSQPGDEVPPGDGDNPPVSTISHTAKITFGPWELLNVCLRYGDYSETDWCGTNHEVEPDSGVNAALAKFISPGRTPFFSRTNSVDHEWQYGGDGEWHLNAAPTTWVHAMELDAVEDFPVGICVAQSLSQGWNNDYGHTWFNEVAVVIDSVEVITKQVYHEGELINRGAYIDEFGNYIRHQRFRGICALPGRRCVFFQRRWTSEPHLNGSGVFVPGVPDPVHAWDLVCYQGTTELFRIAGGTPPETVSQPSEAPFCWMGGHEWFYVDDFWLCDDRLGQNWHTNWVISADGTVRFPQSAQNDDDNDAAIGIHSGAEGYYRQQSTDCVKKPSKLRVGLRKNTWDTSECDP